MFASSLIVHFTGMEGINDSDDHALMVLAVRVALQAQQNMSTELQLNTLFVLRNYNRGMIRRKERRDRMQKLLQEAFKTIKLSHLDRHHHDDYPSRGSWDAQGRTGLYNPVQACTMLYKVAHGCTTPYKPAQ